MIVSFESNKEDWLWLTRVLYSYDLPSYEEARKQLSEDLGVVTGFNAKLDVPYANVFTIIDTDKFMRAKLSRDQ